MHQMTNCVDLSDMVVLIMLRCVKELKKVSIDLETGRQSSALDGHYGVSIISMIVGDALEHLVANSQRRVRFTRFI